MWFLIRIVITGKEEKNYFTQMELVPVSCYQECTQPLSLSLSLAHTHMHAEEYVCFSAYDSVP